MSVFHFWVSILCLWTPVEYRCFYFSFGVLFVGAEVFFVDTGRIPMFYFMSMFWLVCVASTSMFCPNVAFVYGCRGKYGAPVQAQKGPCQAYAEETAQ